MLGLHQSSLLFLLALGLGFERRGLHLDLASGRLQSPVVFSFALLGRARFPLGRFGALAGLAGFVLGLAGVFVRTSHGRLLPVSLGAGCVGRRLRRFGVALSLLQLLFQLGIFGMGLGSRPGLRFSLDLCLGLGLRLGVG